MKIKLMTTLLALLMLAGIGADAQTKVGYTNIDYILTNLPDAKKIQETLTTEKGQYDKLYNDKVADFQKNLEDYQKNAATMSPVIKADKEKYLQNKQGEIQEFQQNSETALQRKQQELLAPVLDKSRKRLTT